MMKLMQETGKVNHSFNLSYAFHLNICLSFVSRYNNFYCTTLFTCWLRVQWISYQLINVCLLCPYAMWHQSYYMLSCCLLQIIWLIYNDSKLCLLNQTSKWNWITKKTQRINDMTKWKQRRAFGVKFFFTVYQMFTEASVMLCIYFKLKHQITISNNNIKLQFWFSEKSIC